LEDIQSNVKCNKQEIIYNKTNEIEINKEEKTENRKESQINKEPNNINTNFQIDSNVNKPNIDQCK